MKKIIKHRLRQFILLFFFIGNVGMLAAQSQRVTIELKNATLKELFSIVEKQHKDSFLLDYHVLIRAGFVKSLLREQCLHS